MRVTALPAAAATVPMAMATVVIAAVNANTKPWPRAAITAPRIGIVVPGRVIAADVAIARRIVRRAVVIHHTRACVVARRIDATAESEQRAKRQQDPDSMFHGFTSAIDRLESSTEMLNRG